MIMLQQIAVGLVVVLAGLYAVWHFMPGAWRQRLGRRLGLSERAAQAGSCHSCDSCHACGGADVQIKK